MAPATPTRTRPTTAVDLSVLPAYTDTSRARLQALYADFGRQKHSSPAAFRANVEWWARTLRAFVIAGLQPSCSHTLILRANNSLPDMFRYEGVGKPLALGTVIAELSEDRSLIPLSPFLSSARSVYAADPLLGRVASTLVGRPLWWALQQAGVVSTDDSETDARRWRRLAGDYVVLGLVENAAERALDHQATLDHGSASDGLYSWADFRKTFAGVVVDGTTLSEEDVKVVVKFLQRDKGVVVADKTVIKFVSSAADESEEITAVDAGLAELKGGVAGLQAQIDGLQLQIDTHNQKAAEAVRAKRLPAVALSHLRARKHAEEVLQRRIGALDTLRATLLQVETSAGDIEIMRTYESSAATLRAVLAHPALQRAHVDETLDALASASADARDVDDVIRAGGQLAAEEAGLAIDEDEIAAELQALADEDRREKEALDAARKAAALGAVPHMPAPPSLTRAQSLVPATLSRAPSAVPPTLSRAQSAVPPTLSRAPSVVPVKVPEAA